MASFLYIFQASPYGCAAGQEGLDAVLAASALDLNCSVLFCDDGVYQLKIGQNSVNGVKQYTKAFAALPDFGVEQIYVESQSLASRGLSLNDLLIEVAVLETHAVKTLIAQQDRVLVF